MYRDIKFRAWDKKQKRWTNYSIVDDLPRFYDKHLGCWKTDKEHNRFSLMQYTGIKDKNGIEIYEGDIVQCTCEDCDGFRYIVQFQDGAFCLNDTEFSIGSWIMNFEHLQDLEVIGNIYENKELLEND